MKKIITLAVISSMMIFSTFAQVSRGNVLMGGSVNFGAGSEKNAAGEQIKTASFGVAPHVGVALSDKWVIGGGIKYGFSHTRIYDPSLPAPGKYRTASNQIGLPYFFARYYKNIIGRFYFVPEMQAGDFMNYTASKTVVERNDVTTINRRRTGGIGISAMPGIAYFVNHCMMLQASFGRVGFTTGTGREEVETGPFIVRSKVNSHQFVADFSPNSLQLALIFILNNNKTADTASPSVE